MRRQRLMHRVTWRTRYATKTGHRLSALPRSNLPWNWGLVFRRFVLVLFLRFVLFRPLLLLLPRRLLPRRRLLALRLRWTLLRTLRLCRPLRRWRLLMFLLLALLHPLLFLIMSAFQVLQLTLLLLLHLLPALVIGFLLVRALPLLRLLLLYTLPLLILLPPHVLQLLLMLLLDPRIAIRRWVCRPRRRRTVIALIARSVVVCRRLRVGRRGIGPRCIRLLRRPVRLRVRRCVGPVGIRIRRTR